MLIETNEVFTLKKELGVYYLVVHIEAELSYTLTVKNSFGEFIPVKAESVTIGTYELELVQDNIYIIDLLYTKGIESTSFTFEIRNYNNLENSTISAIEEILCGCGIEGEGCSKEGCNCSVDECNKCIDSSAMLTNILAYKNLVSISLCEEFVDKFIKAAFLKYSIEIERETSAQYLSKCVTGKSKFNVDLYKLYASIYYSIFYFVAKRDSLPSEVDYIDEKFNKKIIRDCMLRAGYDYNEFRDMIFEALEVSDSGFVGQLNSPTLIITDPSGITPFQYLFGEIEKEEATSGFEINATNVGRLVFIVPYVWGTVQGIEDAYGTNVINSTFAKILDVDEGRDIYITREIVVPGNYEFKLIIQ